MKKFIPLFLFILMSGCAVQVTQLKGSYPVQEREISRSYDQVWSDLVDIFTTRGMPISILDKESGLISSGPVSFLMSYTTENDQGVPVAPEALVVISQVRDPNLTHPNIQPGILTGQWNIRVKPAGSGAIVSINLVNCHGSQVLAGNVYAFDVQSTGVFERDIFDRISRNK